MSDEGTIEQFLYPDYDRDIGDPFGILNMDRAVERLITAFRMGEKIVIYGDYDCDGIPGSVVLHDLFRKIGVSKFVNYIPHRHHEGYGLNAQAITRFGKEGVHLVVTVDCGITDVEEVAMANSLGMDVIITDHHLPQAILPPAFAILNSKQADDTYFDNMLCGAGVAYKLAQGVLARLRENKAGRFTEISPGWEKWLLDMAGLSTIADMVPLQKENRLFAYYGLKVLRKSPRPGLQALLREARVDQRYLTEEDVGFTIGPRINAASRMDIPIRAFELLATRDVVVATEGAKYLSGLNIERKGEVARMVKEAKQLLNKREVRNVIVIGSPKWRVGVAGIVANQLAELYDRPTFVWGKEGSDVIKGSCRSDGRVNIVDLMIEVREGIFLDKGGHEFSGGFSVGHEAIHFLESALIEAHERMPKKEKKTQEAIHDAVLTLEDVNEETFVAIDLLAPFGTGNPKPLFKFEHISILRVEQFGKGREHLKLIFRTRTGNEISALGFFMNGESFPGVDLASGARIDLFATFEKSYFRSVPELRLRIVAIT